MNSMPQALIALAIAGCSTPYTAPIPLKISHAEECPSIALKPQPGRNCSIQGVTDDGRNVTASVLTRGQPGDWILLMCRDEGMHSCAPKAQLR